MEEEVTYFKRLAKFGVFDRLQQQTIRTMAEVFNKLMYAKSFVFIQRTDESVSLISQETPISVLEELAADDNREEMVKVKTLIYIEDEKTSDMSESLDIDYDNCPLNSFKKLVARCNEIIFESPNARSRVDLFKT